MQQLTLTTFIQALSLADDVVLIDWPLPDNIAHTDLFIRRLCTVTSATCQSSDWGADRCAARLQCGPYRLLLNIEWLCDAMWLSADAGETATAGEFFDYFQHLESSQNNQ
ncbi:DUF3630 family protein [Alteromonas sp. CYL-A6]|uniref:DUF3630 family protein n=1 Tax=Alteromonas nitratireducens TaxID=3390813 RepID=UPI0034B593C1